MPNRLIGLKLWEELAMAAVQTRTNMSPLVLAGAIAGVVAGIAFAMVEMLMAEIQGAGFFMPLRMIGAIVLGEDALMSSYSLAGAAVTGAIVHMMMSAIFGAVFGVIVTLAPASRESNLRLVAAATVYGFVLWIVNFYVIAPIAFEWFEMADSTVQFIAHTFFFGSVLGLLILARGSSYNRSVDDDLNR